MRRILVVLTLASCARSVGYEPIYSGGYVADELNMKEPELGLRLDLDLEHSRMTLTDHGAAVGTFTIKRLPDRSKWIGGCGTSDSYQMLEPVELEPKTFTFQGKAFTTEYVHAECYSHGYSVRMTVRPGERWIFKRSP